MKKFLYILCEGEMDEMFYERLAERATGMSFVQPQDLRVRRGANFKTALAAARLLLERVKHWIGQQDVAVIIAIDNDRAPGHPGGSPPMRVLPKVDQKKAPRFSAVKQMVEKKLGENRDAWPVDVAVAMPVEMIESWLLLLVDSQRPDLPLFPRASESLAHQYHGGNPPPQLKDLRDAAAKERQINLDELFLEAAGTGDLKQLAQRSRSYELFETDLRTWRKPAEW